MLTKAPSTLQDSWTIAGNIVGLFSTKPSDGLIGGSGQNVTVIKYKYNLLTESIT